MLPADGALLEDVFDPGLVWVTFLLLIVSFAEVLLPCFFEDMFLL